MQPLAAQRRHGWTVSRSGPDMDEHVQKRPVFRSLAYARDQGHTQNQTGHFCPDKHGSAASPSMAGANLVHVHRHSAAVCEGHGRIASSSASETPAESSAESVPHVLALCVCEVHMGLADIAMLERLVCRHSVSSPGHLLKEIHTPVAELPHLQPRVPALHGQVHHKL